MKRHCALMFMLIIANGSLYGMEEQKEFDELLVEVKSDSSDCDKRTELYGMKKYEGYGMEEYAGLLQKLADLLENLRSDSADGRTALMNAAFEGCDAIVDLLLKNNADPNVLDQFGDSALTYACQWDSYSNPQVVAQLLAAKADVNYKDSEAKTPLFCLREGKRTDLSWWNEVQGEQIEEMLLRAGAKE